MMRSGAALWRLAAAASVGWLGLAGGGPAKAQYSHAPYPTPSMEAPVTSVVPANYAGDIGGPACPAGGCPTASCDCGVCESCIPCRPCYAAARCFDPWYVSISGGWQHRETVHEANTPTTFLEFDDGFAANAALGYRFNNFRVEAEYTFMNNEVERAGFGGANTPATGNVNLRALMFNAYYDLDLPFTVWRPYVGAGIGIYQSEINSLYPDFFVGIPVLEDQPVNTTSDMPLAYQFRAGASRPLGERTEFFAGYRYFHGEELTFASIPFAAPGAPTFHPEGADVHSAEFGLRIRF